jgi:hypothetical protein
MTLVKIPFVIEETIKTMKMDEVCVVLCDNHNEWIGWIKRKM